MPRPPAFETAAASSARPTHCIPPCTMGTSTPNTSVNLVWIIDPHFYYRLENNTTAGLVTFVPARSAGCVRRRVDQHLEGEREGLGTALGPAELMTRHQVDRRAGVVLGELCGHELVEGLLDDRHASRVDPLLHLGDLGLDRAPDA